MDQTDQDAHGEGAAAETERPDVIAGLIIAAQKFVEVEHIALHANPKRGARARAGFRSTPTPSPNTATWLPSVRLIA